MKLELLLGRQVEFVCNNMVIEAVRARVKEAAIASATHDTIICIDCLSLRNIPAWRKKATLRHYLGGLLHLVRNNLCFP